jgi:hypothetical protein
LNPSRSVLAFSPSWFGPCVADGHGGYEGSEKFYFLCRHRARWVATTGGIPVHCLRTGERPGEKMKIILFTGIELPLGSHSRNLVAIAEYGVYIWWSSSDCNNCCFRTTGPAMSQCPVLVHVV